MKAEAVAMIESVGKVKERVVQASRSAFWYELEAYKPYFETFFQRPEYAGYEKKALKAGK
ncbi:hypothetical protein SCARR_05633 [Pontiella sulfatireligans]|uniref:Uncharacterized protein n=2 Tax=Pontiella sulfatireligans TaxID=2750658 RepID=A0A6C2UXE1_9BACT|nr:hypothetical protein SCARR_05633 [Pontiella sulfatireligans]